MKIWATSNNSYGYNYGNNFSTRGVYRDEDFEDGYGNGNSIARHYERSLPAVSSEPLHIRKILL